jgi:hypothetical protein
VQAAVAAGERDDASALAHDAGEHASKATARAASHFRRHRVSHARGFPF